MARFKKGQVSWNKNKKGYHIHSEEFKLKARKRWLENNPNYIPEIRKKITQSNKGKERLKIKGVNNPFYGKTHNGETKRKISLLKLGRKLSEETKERMKGRKGNKNPAWKGGISKLNWLIRQLRQYAKYRSDILERDNWTCQICRKRGCILEVHHIKEFNQIIKDFSIDTTEKASKCQELWDINNGITLCFDCHQLTKRRR